MKPMSTSILDKERLTATQIGRFSDVDATGQADRYIAILDSVERLPHVVATRERSYELLDIDAGQTIVDVGCGAGRVVDELTARGVYAIGIDSSEKMISTARYRFPQRDFRLGSAGSLPLQDSSVHRYRAERLYVHLKDPMAALAEARRVLAPGGRVVLVDVDYDVWAIDADDIAMTRAILAAYAATFVSPWIGRRLRGLLLDAGFEDVMVEVNTDVVTDYTAMEPFLPSWVAPSVSSGVLTRAQADTWLAEQARRGETNRFLRLFSMFVASAHRP
jgi:ubiquinone/menaquinone biosynthesis C-methylase UbiE